MRSIELLKIEGVEKVFVNDPPNELSSGYTSDLMSDVMKNGVDDSLLITIQAHKNTIAVCDIAGITAVLLCDAKQIPADMLEAAKENSVDIYRTNLNQFEASWKVHALLESAK